MTSVLTCPQRSLAPTRAENTDSMILHAAAYSPLQQGSGRLAFCSGGVRYVPDCSLWSPICLGPLYGPYVPSLCQFSPPPCQPLLAVAGWVNEPQPPPLQALCPRMGQTCGARASYCCRDA